jgi:Protein of unknown function (DUF1761)
MILPIFLAALASFAVGALWYGPVFGKQWMKMMNFTPESMKAMSMTPARAMTLGFISQLVFAFVLSRFVDAVAMNAWGAMVLAFWIWLGFYATTTLGGYLWEGKSCKLVAFNMAYQLVGLLVTAAVLGALL